MRGREFRPTDADRAFVDRAVMAGSRIMDIAAALDIDDETLRKHFRFEIMTARERLKSDAVRVLMDSLTDGSLDAAKYVLSRVAGWTERTAVEVTGAGGGPIQTIDPSRLSDAALAELLAARHAAPGADDN